MNKERFLKSFFRTIDKIFFGIEDWDEAENQSASCEVESEEQGCNAHIGKKASSSSAHRR